ncbi:MAG: hypothetical protein OEV78_00850 [Spirochaetia bacterium]|nr:hypothetical protein [Spirochaetia bacterium]
MNFVKENNELIENPLNQMNERLEKVLTKIIADHNSHAKWINLLSYLEFIGSRKIFKTQKNGFISEELLKHASDEARHALILKQMIGKITENENFQYYDSKYMINAYSGFRYIQNLDSMVKKQLLKISAFKEDFSYMCYVYVSYVIEVRANWLYAIYSGLLSKTGSNVNVSAIISDEVRHLDDMTCEIGKLDPNSESNIVYFLNKEGLLFERFLCNLEKSLN